MSWGLCETPNSCCFELVLIHRALHAVVRAQNNLTQQVLSTCDTRSKFKALMTEMYNFPKISCPFQRGEAGGVLRCVTAFPHQL